MAICRSGLFHLLVALVLSNTIATSNANVEGTGFFFLKKKFIFPPVKSDYFLFGWSNFDGINCEKGMLYLRWGELLKTRKAFFKAGIRL